MKEYEVLLQKFLNSCDHNNTHNRVMIYELQENERMAFEKLMDLGLLSNITHIGMKNVGFDLTYDAIHYFDESDDIKEMEYSTFSYEMPADFSKRVFQILSQTANNTQVALAFKNCKYEYEDLGLAYYAGVKGDNWDKRALDFTFEGTQNDINALKMSNALKNAISKALRSNTSGFVLREILYLIDENDLFPASDQDRFNADIFTANMVLNDIVKISEKLCSNATYNKDSSENSINDYYRDSFSLMGYLEVKDQTRHGISLSGKDAGEVDILISKNGKEIAIFEGLKLDHVNSSYIDEHIDKAIINYNALGTATFVVAYVSAANFATFWERYFAHLQQYTFPVPVKKDISAKAQPNAAIKIGEMILSRDNFDFPVYFIAINISQ